jgi:hypothetical protein
MYFLPCIGTTYTRATRSSLLVLTVRLWDQFPRWCRSRRRLSVCCFEVSRFVITVQREFLAWFKADAPHKSNLFFKPCTKLTLYCNHRSEHLKTAYRKPSPAATLYWKLVLRPHGKHEKQPAVSAWETWTVSAADSVCCARVGWEIHFFNNFWNRTILLCMPCIVYFSYNYSYDIHYTYDFQMATLFHCISHNERESLYSVS